MYVRTHVRDTLLTRCQKSFYVTRKVHFHCYMYPYRTMCFRIAYYFNNNETETLQLIKYVEESEKKKRRGRGRSEIMCKF